LFAKGHNDHACEFFGISKVTSRRDLLPGISGHFTYSVREGNGSTRKYLELKGLPHYVETSDFTENLIAIMVKRTPVYKGA
jgi:hypothetical protein